MILTRSEKTNFAHYPLLWLAIFFAAGIIVAEFSGIGPVVFLLLCILPPVLSLAVNKDRASAVCILAAFLAAGGLTSAIERRGFSENRLKSLYDSNRINSGDPIEIEGVLTSEPEQAVGGVFLLLKSESAIYKGWGRSVSGSVRLFAVLRDEEAAGEFAAFGLGYGSRVRVACRLKRQDNFLNPGSASRKEILDRQNIDASGTVKSPLLIEKLSDGPTYDPLTYIFGLRKRIIGDFREMFNEHTSGILIASMLGNKYFLDKSDAELFREDGTFHVLVISGLHITFIGGLTLIFARLFTKRRLWQFILVSSFLWAYAIAVGAEAPVVRAALMFTLLLFSRVIYRRGSLLNSLGGCMIILLVWRPEDIFNPSFQLTLVSVTAIIAMAFPLIEQIRAIGSWSPSAETPFPPDVPGWLRRFSEMIYWSDEFWKIEAAKLIWSGQLSKKPYLKWLAQKRLQGIMRYVFEGMIVSLVVQIWLLPLLIVYFHRLTLFSVILNLWVGLNIALASLSAIAALLISKLSGPLAQPFAALTDFLTWLLLAVSGVLVEINLASVRVPVYSGKMKAVYFAFFLPLIVLSAVLAAWRPFGRSHGAENTNFGRWAGPALRFSLISLLLMSTAIVFHPFSAPNADGRLHVDFLDVGQGDSALITFPDGQTMLIDGGGRMKFDRTDPDDADASQPFEPDTPTIGESVVSEFLWEKGYSRINYILATHADADHIQGLADVAKNFQVGKAIFGRMPADDREFADIAAVLKMRGITSELAARGDLIKLGGVTVEVLYPPLDERADAASDNNHSVVLRIVFGSRTILLTGDIERETETKLVQNSVLQTDVVKVAHHGSRTSSSPGFIAAANAAYAIIPVGLESPFGHPHAEVVERWRRSGARILTTGTSGTISVSTDGHDLEIRSFVK